MNKSAFFMLILLFLIAVSACAPSYLGYGVILWGEDGEPFRHGEIVKILSESKLNEAYIVEGGEKNTEIKIPLWQVEFFKKNAEAADFAEAYQPYLNTYVYSTKEGIPPVRENQGNSNSNKIIYKFKANQIAKVLGRSEQKEQISNMEDYWYRVLIKNEVPLGNNQYTTVGIQGYCFGYYLKVVTAQRAEDIVIINEEELQADAMLNYLFSGNWRPITFQDMLDEARIDLDKFNPAWGIFPDREQQRISILLEDARYTADYYNITQIKSNLYTFPDSTLKIEILSPNRLSATFVTEGRQMNVNFANIRRNPEDIIAAEQERRNQLYNRFITSGPLYSSSAYGEIEFKDANEFYWTGLSKLIPGILPRQVTGYGTVSFPYFTDPALTTKYDGVITMHFNGYDTPAGINFLYQFVENGVKLFYIDNGNIVGKEVIREGNNQFIIFFLFKET